MNGDGERWGVVLAGGSGTRLSALTTDAAGTMIPKQYCSFLGGPSLLRTTIERLTTVLDSSRIVVVVSAKHRRWWEPELTDIAPENVIVQPCDRGTACGILLPLTSILLRDPKARIVVSPADHYIRNWETLTRSLAEAQAHVDSRPESMVLLGMEPDRPETEYGWITPSSSGEDAVRVVTSFVEKPEAELARELLESGALWSSLTFVATGQTLMQHFRLSMPWLVNRFSLGLAFGFWDTPQHALLSLYDKLPDVDFSRRILERTEESIYVLPVPPCGWTDLGSPRRVSECAMKNSCPYHGPSCPTDRCSGKPTELRQTATGSYRPCAIDLAEVALNASEPEALGLG